MTESRQVAMLKLIRDRLALEHEHCNAWDTQDWVTRDEREPPEAGWVFWVREQGGQRQIRITVTDLGFVGDGVIEPAGPAGQA